MNEKKFSNMQPRLTRNTIQASKSVGNLPSRRRTAGQPEQSSLGRQALTLRKQKTNEIMKSRLSASQSQAWDVMKSKNKFLKAVSAMS